MVRASPSHRGYFCHLHSLDLRPGSAHNEEELTLARESYTPSAYDARPGLGGYAQLKMSREHDLGEKAGLDHEYVKRMNLWFDAKIFFGTISPYSVPARGNDHKISLSMNKYCFDCPKGLTSIRF